MLIRHVLFLIQIPKPMNSSRLMSFFILCLVLPYEDVSSQHEFADLGVVVIDNTPALVRYNDANNIDNILMLFPEYTDNKTSDDEYIHLFTQSHAEGLLEYQHVLRFIEFSENRVFLNSEGVEDIRFIATKYAESEDCMIVVITAPDVFDSTERITNILHSLRAFGVQHENIKVAIREANNEITDGIVKVHIEPEHSKN